MERRGYYRGGIIGSIAGGGTLGILIPPSIPLIIYGSWQDVSIGRLFLAGIVPGLLMAFLFMVYVAIRAGIRPAEIPPNTETYTLGAALKRSLHAWPFVALILTILGTTFTGITTPTESAALGAAAAIVLAALYREITL